MKPVRRLLPYPVLSLLVGLTWLLLMQSLALPQVITAVVLAVLIPRLVRGLLGDPGRISAPWTVVVLTAVVLRDIILSNIVVARIVLNPWSKPRPAWVRVGLDLDNPQGVVLLATIITMTPGTVSSIVDEAARCIWVHALDCADTEALAAQIKKNYESRLKEIFQ